MLQPLVLFFGLIVIPEYMYRFKGSVAKYELMILDVTRVVYDKEDTHKRKFADQESIRLNEESLRKARERNRDNEWQEKKLSELT
ncbi:hypothetical protein [Dysgonomonas sp. 25]|uniref:hypothetical protein n=1 Tax=Dysgonomonas sp. 25 TaxID=2302933 RepID=UPI0013D883A6|nr:hypothetical protein [Dysgonomonas sp. 25]